MNLKKSLISSVLFVMGMATASMALAQPDQAADDEGRNRFFAQAAIHIGVAVELARLCPVAKVSLNLDGAIRKGLAGDTAAMAKLDESIASMKEVSTSSIQRIVARTEDCKGEAFNDLLAYVERENDTLLRQWGKKDW